MNICFFTGKVISNPEFKFVLNRKHKMNRNYHSCILLMDFKIDNGSTMKLKLYDKNAEFGFKVLKVNDDVFICGIIVNMYEIIVNKFFRVKLID